MAYDARMIFRNDVTLDEIPRVGTGTALVAARTVAGEAVQYTGPDDIVALAEFLGNVLIVAGTPYIRSALNGTLVPFEFQTGVAYVKPPAGEPFTLRVDELAQRTAIVQVPAPVEPEPQVELPLVAGAWDDANHAQEYVDAQDKVVAGTVVYPARPERAKPKSKVTK